MKPVSQLSSILLSLGIASSAVIAAPALKTDKDKISYLIGFQIGTNFKRDGIEVDDNVLLKGLKDAVAGKKSPLSEEESKKVMENFQKNLQAKAEAKHKEEATKNAKEGKDFLAKNAKKPGVITTASGLQYKIEKAGSGTPPKATDTVKVNYRGTLISGTEFDSSYKRGEPVTFPVNGVIKGWTEALQLMKPGAKWKLFIPADLAYGDRGAGGLIGPNSTLIFEVELLSVEPPKTASNKPAAAAPKK